MEYIFKKVDKEHVDLLLDWRNDELTRRMFIDQKKVSNEEHKAYMKKLNEASNIKQFIFYHDDKPVGTIRENIKSNNEKRLSYTINPKFRTKGYGKLMMSLFLFDRSGKFICKVKTDNIGSVKVCISNNYSLMKSENGFNYYVLEK